MAWKGPVIQSSTCERADAAAFVLTATLPLFPARSPSAVHHGPPSTSSCVIVLFSDMYREWLYAPALQAGTSVTDGRPDMARK